MRGIHLEGKKESSLISWTIRRPSLPAKVRIPLCDQNNTPATCFVEVGSHVLAGEKIAETNDLFPIAIHASISGKITCIDSFPHPIFESSRGVEITSDGRDEKLPSVGRERPNWNHLSKELWFHLFHECGLQEVVHELRPNSKQEGMDATASTLIVNACESEPYLTSDHALMMSHPMEVLKGADILRRFLGAEKVVLAIEDDKMEVAELLKSKIYFLKWRHIEVKILPTLFPQGLNVPLRQTVLNHPIADYKLDSEENVRIINVSNAFAIYEAIALQKPQYERPVTMAGECLVEPKNIWVRFGTSFEDAIKTCRGLLREPRKVLMGGPMQGLAQKTLEVPVIEKAQAILALPKEVAAPEKVDACIRCSLCVEVCPVEISPVMITLAAEKDRFDIAEKWGAHACIDCGNCSYVCPAKRPMLELIRYASTHSDPMMDPIKLAPSKIPAESVQITI